MSLADHLNNSNCGEGTLMIDYFGGLPSSWPNPCRTGPTAADVFSVRCVYAPIDPASSAGRWPGVFRPLPGATWWHEGYDFDGDAERSFTFGTNCDIAVVGDWDGDGDQTPGVFRPFGGGGSEWHISNNDDGAGSTVYVFGDANMRDIPVAGDWNGDGADTIGVWRPTTGYWYLRNANHEDAGMVAPFAFGMPDLDRPAVGDWDLDNPTEVGVFRPSNTSWHLKRANDASAPLHVPPFQYGNTGDYPVTGDWDAEGFYDTIGVFRTTGGNAQWLLRNLLAGGNADISFSFGATTSDKPVPGDWNCGFPC